MLLRGGGGGAGGWRGSAPSHHSNNTPTLIHGRFKAFLCGGGPLAASAWTVKTVRSPTAQSHAGCLIECVCGCASAPEGFNNLAVFRPGF